MINDFCIISSNCIAGFWYRDVIEEQYETPFIWSIIRLSDMLYLIRNFENIDFSDIDVLMSDGELNRKDGNRWVKIFLNGKVNVYFVHYREEKSLKNETIIKGTRVISDNILKYAKETWLRRCYRIPYEKKRVWVFWDDPINTDVNLSEFVNVSKEYENDIFVLFTPENKYVSEKKLNCFAYNGL